MRDPRHPLTVVVIDDHLLFSQGLEHVLNHEGNGCVRVVGSTDDADRAVELIGQLKPGLAIVDLSMPPPGGLECIRRITTHFPHVAVLALSGNDCVEMGVEALAAGADAFLSKSAAPDALVPLVCLAGDDLAVVPRALIDVLLTAGQRPDQRIPAGLTSDEVTLWRAVARDSDPAEMTACFGVSDRTIKRMTASLLRKLGVNSRVQAASLAGVCGLLDGPHEIVRSP